MSLRRIFLKPGGMGSSEDYWREACFTVVSFGVVLGGSTSQLAINDCAETFISEAPRKSLTNSIYMDDIMLGSDSPENSIENMVQEVDSGLKKGNFEVKEWVKTGDYKQIKFLSYLYHAKTETFSVCLKVN